MTIVNPLDLDSLHLDRGAHDSFDDGVCLMEAVAYVAGESWSDHPQCASPVLGAFLRSWQDALGDEDRQQLKPYIPRLIGTRGSMSQEDARSWMALDWLVRDYTPVWLRLAGLTDQADLLAGLSEFKAGIDVQPIRPAIAAVRKDANAARAAARAAARDAARVAAWVAARDAAGDAARDAAGDADGVAAGAAARDAAWVAAWVAAWDALAPAVVECQQSAHRLVDRMIAVTDA